MNVSRLCYLALRGDSKTILNQKIYQNVRTLCTNTARETQKRQVSSLETKQLQKTENLVTRVLRKIPFFKLNRTQLMASSYLLYESIADRVNYISFFDELDLPDTFYSWFVVTELHIWLITVRAMAEGDDGRLLRNYLVEALWNDVAQRVKKLGGGSNPSVARAQVRDLSEQLQAALIAYDEGLQGDDTVLAGALWRRFYQQQDVDPRYLEILVRYIRKQMRLLDYLSREQLLQTTKLKWIPVKE